MRSKYYLLIFIFLINIINTNASTIDELEDSKKDLISKASTGNIKAMIKLNKLYHFPETKEGLSYYKKWYSLVLQNKKLDQVSLFRKLFYKYKEMFINGDDKYASLLLLEHHLGNKDASLKLIKLYFFEDRNKSNQIKKEYIKTANVKDLIKLYRLYKKRYNQTEASKISDIIAKRGYAIDLENRIQDLKIAYHNGRNIDDILELIKISNNFEMIYKAANFILGLSSHKYKNKSKELYEEALKLTSNKKTKATIYNILGDVYYYSLKDKKTGIKYYKKAIDLKDIDAMNNLLDIYKTNKYKKEYSKFKKKLLQTNVGKKIFAKYLYGGFSNDKKLSFKYFDELAKSGDKESIGKLAREGLYYYYTKKENDIFKKWQKYILHSDDVELFEYIRLNTTSGKLANKFLNDIKKAKEASKNIMVLRNLSFFSIGNHSKNRAILEKAYSYGDVYSGLKLAKIYLRYKDKEKALKIYRELEKKGEMKAKKALERLKK